MLSYIYVHFYLKENTEGVLHLFIKKRERKK